MRKYHYIDFLSKRLNPLDAARRFGEEFIESLREHMGEPVFYPFGSLEEELVREVAVGSRVVSRGELGVDVLVKMGRQEFPYGKGLYFESGGEEWLVIGDGVSEDDFKKLLLRFGGDERLGGELGVFLGERHE